MNLTETEMEIRVFNIVSTSEKKGTLHEICEGLPTEGTAQQDAMDAAEALCRENVFDYYIDFTRACPLSIWYDLKEGYQDTDWYKQHIAK